MRFWDFANGLARKQLSTSGCCQLRCRVGWRRPNFWWWRFVLGRTVISQNLGIWLKGRLNTWGFRLEYQNVLPRAFCEITNTQNVQFGASFKFYNSSHINIIISSEVFSRNWNCNAFFCPDSFCCFCLLFFVPLLYSSFFCILFIFVSFSRKICFFFLVSLKATLKVKKIWNWDAQ